jgi:mRNA-degrading endonuclease RelE of RelBE toxin-antitoxin system
LAWTIEYAETARKQLRKLDKAAARVAPNEDPRWKSTQKSRPVLKYDHGQ